VPITPTACSAFPARRCSLLRPIRQLPSMLLDSHRTPHAARARMLHIIHH
jgi:hypothetical protein